MSDHCRESKHQFTGNTNIESISTNQMYDSLIPLGCHQGHITIQFNNKIESDFLEHLHNIPGIDKSGLFNYDTAVLISIADENDAFKVVPKVGKLLLENKIITHEELSEMNSDLDVKSKPARKKGGAEYVRI